MCHIYILYAAYSREKTGDIRTFTKFEEGGLLYETCDNTENGNESDNDSTMAPLMNEEEMDAMSSGDKSDTELISTDMLEYIRDGSHSHPSLDTREAHCRICYSFLKRQAEWK